MSAINIYTHKNNHYKTASIALLTTASVALAVLMGLSHYRVVSVRHSASKFLSHDLALRASVVAIVSFFAIFAPYGVAHYLTQKRDHLKLSDTTDQQITAIVSHNSNLLASKRQTQVVEGQLKAITSQMIADSDCDPLAVVERLCKWKFEWGDDELPQQEVAEYFLKAVEQKQLKMPVQLMGSRAFGSVVAVIGNIIGAVGLADLFKTSEDDMQASFKAQKILMLVSLINILIQILIPVLGAKTAGMAIGSAVGGLTLVSLVWPKIKPIPERLPGNAINLTEEVLQGKIEPSDSRPVVTEGLHRTLKSGKHALLIGPSRMGKTQALKAFAEKVTRGEYPQFKGKKVWYWNTADLAEHQSSMIMGGTNNPLRNIRENVGRNMDNIIFCFDEIHSAMTKEDSALPEQMKTAFDEGGPFKHVIGITTDEEYQQYVAPNRALANRFSHVRVETMDKESTIRVLSDMILRHPNMPILDEGILEYIYTKTTTDETIPQPFTACGVLSRCLEQLEGSVITTLAQEISQIEGRISAQHAIAITTTSVPQTKELKQQLVEKKQEMEQKVEQVTKLKRAKQLLFAVRKGKYEAALKEQKRTYTVLSKVEAQLKAQIEALSTELEIPAKITKEMVDGIINPTLESDV